MYKLVIVAGKLRGQEFELAEGENILGRDPDADISIDVPGVSKKHLSVTVTEDAMYVEDQGSANGTFLNGKMIKRATVKSGDKIALPNLIIQVVLVKEKKIIIHKEVESDEDGAQLALDGSNEVPVGLIAKIKHKFKYKLMLLLYGINEEYEWKILIALILTLFVFVTITLTIFPVLQDSKKLLLWETAKRGEHFADEIARMNAVALEQNNLDNVNTNFLEKEQGVASYELFDLEGRIVRPIGQLNDFISDTFSIQAREWAVNVKGEGTSIIKKMLPGGQIGIAGRIMAYNAKSGAMEPVGIIAIRFRPKSLAIEAAKNSKAYLESLTTSALVAVLFFGVIYFLTLRPIEELTLQMEEALRGKRKGIEGKYLMGELDSLKNAVNTTLQRIRELQSDGTEEEFGEAEDDAPYVTSLAEFMNGAGVPVMILDSSKNVQRLNVDAEDITGIRMSVSQGQNILDVAKERGFAATLIELCDNSANNGGTSQDGSYELTGRNFNLYVTSIMGKDNFAKAFYITFIQES
ncbi:MAG: FHA domain-containing protein [Bacteriovoracaceae bacterium]|nr:FHA domain-containing protein [Bacteriovoracaceae bacterium]